MEILNSPSAYSFHPPMECAVSMTNATANTVAAQLEDVKKLVYLGLVWLGGLSGYLYLQHGDIRAIKQSIADHGLGQIVSDLNAPKSPAQLQASLSTVVAQVQTARADGKAPNKEKVAALSSALSDVVQKNPTLPEAWKAASELISYRTSEAIASSSAQCDGPESIGSIDPNDHFDPNNITIPVAVYRNCTMDIGDIAGYQNGKLSNAVRSIGKKDVYFTLALDHVHVIYRGGPVIPVALFVFSNCSFDFQLNGPPPPQGERITKTLLASENPENVRVKPLG